MYTEEKRECDLKLSQAADVLTGTKWLQQRIVPLWRTPTNLLNWLDFKFEQNQMEDGI